MLLPSLLKRTALISSRSSLRPLLSTSRAFATAATSAIHKHTDPTFNDTRQIRYRKMSKADRDRLRECNTMYVVITPAEERAIMLRVLNDCFKHQTLEGVPFFRALQSGEPVETGVGYEKCEDVRLLKMINTYPNAQKRAKLLHIFKSYQNGGPVTEPPEPTPSQSTQQQQSSAPECKPVPVPDQMVLEIGNIHFSPTVNRPGMAKLNEIVPDIEKNTFSRDLLDSLTKSRFNTLVTYLNELQEQVKNHPRLSNDATFTQLKNILTNVNNQTHTLISIDIEAHEHNQRAVTEIGISIYDPAKEATSIFPSFKNIHILPEEHIRLRNGSYVPDNKDKFLGGSSIILPMKKAIDLVQCIIDYYFIHRAGSLNLKGVLVGHDVSGDVSWLKQLGVEFPAQMMIADTQTLYGLTHGQNHSSLGGILRRFDIPHSYLHNAGNDAFYTLMLLLKLCDPQFRRWQGVDSIKEDVVYQAKLKTRRDVPPAQIPKVKSSARPKKGKKSNESLPPMKYNNYSHALSDVFKSSAD